MINFNTYANYLAAERWLINEILHNPTVEGDTFNELLCAGFSIDNPRDNRNGRSNYEYAEKFFEWLLTGDTDLSSELLRLNPWVKRFTDTTGLPDSFSSSYGAKIKAQLPAILEELRRPHTRRAYISVLQPADHVILGVKTTHEFPCTVGLHLLPRDGRLHMIVNMRSNNCWSVLPYDVFNFTSLQVHLAKEAGLALGRYTHQINSAHLFRGDMRRILQGGLEQ